MIKNQEYPDRYTRRLLPFVLLSIMVHLVILGGSLAYASLTGSDKGIKLTVYEPFDNPGDIKKQSGHPGDENDPSKITRHRIYRVDYFKTLLIENPIKQIAPKIIKSITPPKPAAKPIPKAVIPSEKSAEEKSSDEIVNPAGKVFLQNEMETTGEPLAFPEYLFTMIPYNEKKWVYFSSQACKGYDMVYFVVDISKKDGFKEYFEWARFLDFLLSIKGVQDPPTPVGIAEILEDPYFLTPDLAADAMRRELEKEEFKTPAYRDFNFVDFQGQIVNTLKISELPLPQVYFVDYTGAVRLKIEGRISEIPMDQIRKALGVIKDIWGMTDLETALATGAVISYQQNLEKEKKLEGK